MKAEELQYSYEKFIFPKLIKVQALDDYNTLYKLPHWVCLKPVGTLIMNNCLDDNDRDDLENIYFVIDKFERWRACFEINPDKKCVIDLKGKSNSPCPKDVYLSVETYITKELGCEISPEFNPHLRIEKPQVGIPENFFPISTIMAHASLSAEEAKKLRRQMAIGSLIRMVFIDPHRRIYCAIKSFYIEFVSR